ncbi:TerC/Alx family metal homeostasis membrane protein [Edaphobacter modestus]|uniref:Tellurite resistance protein TerC n=1 Tax=Edaphobacter modestus TaxID=388466 RepID=A0A4Q7YQZ5_9BACT|nr:TerC/Alx family metal homeostasis membrane protein [Edaphobacter modestus]RZU40097.1 tellurite resistance protein TerC [Edaphobacter modestus]
MPDATPVSTWIWFHIFVFTLMAGDYLYVRWMRSRRPAKDTLHSTSVVATIMWVCAALGLAVFILRAMGSEAATQYLAGYAIEEALSVDNLFVFLLLFKLFRIEPQNQPRVLFWGVAGAIVMRGLFISAGIELLTRFEWVSYLFALVLLIASIRLLLPQDADDEKKNPRWLVWISRLRPVSLRQDVFVTKEDGTRMVTVLLLALIAIEVTDLIFAIDSIPAVLSITRHPFLAYTSNIMAVMGLRSLYFLLAHLLTKLRYLHYGLAAILIFAAAKMLTAHFFRIGPLVSLSVVIAMLAITVGVSLLAGARKAEKV